MYKLFILIAVVWGISGCALVGPKMSSPKVYASVRDVIVAQNEAHKTYWEKQEESYEAGTGGEVERRGALLAPGDYHEGVFLNRRNRTVTFVLRGGGISLFQEVAAHSPLEVLLVPGSYDVALYEAGRNWSYLTYSAVVDRSRDDNTVNGQVYDFFMIAP